MELLKYRERDRLRNIRGGPHLSEHRVLFDTKQTAREPHSKARINKYLSVLRTRESREIKAVQTSATTTAVRIYHDVREHNKFLSSGMYVRRKACSVDDL